MICGCVNEKTENDAIASIRLAKKEGAEIVELRIDRLENPEEAVEIIKKSALPVIAVCRPKTGTEETMRISILQKAILAGAKYVDIEMETKEDDYEKIADSAGKNNCMIICSFHDFNGTPAKEELHRIAERMKLKKCDILKIVTTAHSADDGYRVLEIAKGKNNIIAFAMGEAGRFTRIVCLFCGALWTYCKISGGTAPGQYSIREMKEKLAGMDK